MTSGCGAMNWYLVNVLRPSAGRALPSASGFAVANKRMVLLFSASIFDLDTLQACRATAPATPTSCALPPISLLMVGARKS